MPPLTNYQPVPSEMSFRLDAGPVTPPATRRAYVLSSPGVAVVLTLQGTGPATVDVLTSIDGIDFTLLVTRTAPGTWRHEVAGMTALAVRVASAGPGAVVTGVLSHGGIIPITNVSSLFNAFLIFSHNATTSEPPVGNQIRFDVIPMSGATKCWLSNTSTDGTDHYQAVRKIPNGGTLMIQQRTDHTHAALFRINGPLIDKTSYVEIPLLHQQSQGLPMPEGQVLLAVFNPGPTIALTPGQLGTPVIGAESERYGG